MVTDFRMPLQDKGKKHEYSHSCSTCDQIWQQHIIVHVLYCANSQRQWQPSQVYARPFNHDTTIRATNEEPNCL